ncbi:hypothetical protein KAR91_81345, partial [Candidatus Pacearchaeota archaeon]|nr:hypothetical protein [Candidatus Pacearchaeota archaeon]
MNYLLCNQTVVKNILAGTQTQDRRPVKPQPKTSMFRFFPHVMDDVGADKLWTDGCEQWKPPHQVGDVLYVRETFASNQKWFVAYAENGECGAFMGDGGGGTIWNRHGYLAPKSRNIGVCGINGGVSDVKKKFGKKWKP